ncbi:MAG: nuclear transport factor 2 family protein [Acidimicrobiales bacterium]|nr:nuclear transport factor 2 family protein [Acidimicrobiales bacterium]
MTSLENSLRAYAEFLEEQSIDVLPDHTPLNDRLTEPSEGDVIMIDDLEKSPDPNTKERVARSGRVRTMFAAAAIVVVALAAAVLLWPESTTEVDTAENSADLEVTEVELPTEPLDVVERYYEFFAAGDLDGLGILIADDAQINDNWLEYTKEQWLRRAAYYVGQGATHEDRICELDPSSGAVATVVCSHGTLTAAARPTGETVPIERRITVLDGRILVLGEVVRAPDWITVSASFEQWASWAVGEPPDNTECCEWDSIDDALAGGQAIARLVAEWESDIETFGCELVDRPCTAETGLGRSFVVARGEWDGAAVAELIGESAEVDELATTRDDYLAVAEFERAIGRTFEIIECKTGASTSERIGRWCSYFGETDWSRALGDRPERGVFDLVFVEGEIVEISDSPQLVDTNAWTVFEAWLRDNHADDVATMIDLDGSKPLLTTESIALWEQHTSEFVAEVSTG